MKNQELGTATRVIILAMVISVLSLFVLVGVLVLIHICVVLREFNRRTDNINMAERGSTSMSMSMSKEDIEKHPCFVFQAKEKGTSTPVDCAICLDNFKAKSLLRERRAVDFVDPKLHGDYSTDAFQLTLELAISCIAPKQQRPSIENVVDKLEEALACCMTSQEYQKAGVKTTAMLDSSEE